MAVSVYRVSYDKFGTAEQRRGFLWRMTIVYGAFVGTILLVFMRHDFGDLIQMVVDAVILYSAATMFGYVLHRLHYYDYTLQISDDGIVVVKFGLRRTFPRSKITSIRERAIWPFGTRGLVVSDGAGLRSRLMGTAFIPDFLPEYPQIREQLAGWKTIEVEKTASASLGG